MEQNRRPIGSYEYYRKRELLTNLMRQFFNYLRQVELVADDDIAAFLYEEGGRLMECLVAMVRRTILEELTVQAHRRTQAAGQQKEYTKEQLQKLLLAKDEVWLADRRYILFRELASLEQILPPIHLINSVRQEVNASVCGLLGINVPLVEPEDPKYLSCFVDVRKCFEFMFIIHSSKFPTQPTINDVVIKFSFDGRQNAGNEVLIGVIPQIHNVMSQSGYDTFPLAILRCSEDEACPTIVDIATKLMAIDGQLHTFNDKLYRLYFMICSDLLSLWKSTGLDYDSEKNSKFCPFCLKLSRDVCSWGGAQARATLPKINWPVSRFIYCALHAGIRLTERIIILVGETLYDNQLPVFQKNLRALGVKIYVNKKERDFVKVYMDGGTTEKFMGIENGARICEGGKTLIKLYNGDKMALANLLLSWQIIYRSITCTRSLEPIEMRQLQAQCVALFDNWNDLFPSSATPYLHIVTHHSVEIIQRWGSIGRYSQQGFEHTNKDQKQVSRHGTSHGGGWTRKEATKQLMENTYRRMDLAAKFGKTDRINAIMRRSHGEGEPAGSLLSTPPSNVELRRIVAEIVGQQLDTGMSQMVTALQNLLASNPSNNAPVENPVIAPEPEVGDLLFLEEECDIWDPMNFNYD